MASIFAGCSDACGWAAAIVSSISFGSFGVPIKAIGSKIDVDPLVMQSYKTIVCFLTCWFVVFFGEEIRWTPWGIVSGLFWVPGATGGIYGIRNAGLAIAVGTWSSIIVMTSFLWGVFIFHEGVKSVEQTMYAMMTLSVGLVGMSRYAKPTPKKASSSETSGRSSSKMYDDDSTQSSDSEDDISPASSPVQKKVANKRRLKRRETPPVLPETSGPPPVIPSLAPLEVEPLMDTNIESELSPVTDKDSSTKDRVILFGRFALTRRQLGILGAAFNGAWGGTSLIPLHYAARAGFGGPGYLISYATGSLLVNIAMWILRIAYIIYQKNFNVEEALESLPNWHFKELWLPGLLAGSYYSLGNFSSILSVTYLGQAVGYSFCQGQILVSGLWGIFYYKEISGRETIAKWFGSAIVTLVGVVWLSYEHIGTDAIE